MEEKQILLNSIDKLHTTEMGINRIKRNLKTDAADIVEYCRNKILDQNCHINRQGKTGIVKLTMLKSPSTHTALRLSRHTG